jgi:membrane protease YdiL (CAAX protease family)
MRWKWFFYTFGICFLGYIVLTIGQFAILGAAQFGFDDMELKDYTVMMAVIILVTSPLQAAGEELQSRALIPRIIASLVPHRWFALLFAALGSSLLFMVLHNSQDLWINLNYLGFGLALWWLTYRTGGIEASIALHVVHSLFNQATMPFSDFSTMFDRGEGTGSPFMLVYLGFQIILVVFIDALARHKGLVRLSSPSKSQPEVVIPSRFVTRLAESTSTATIKELPRIDKTERLIDEPVRTPRDPVRTPRSSRTTKRSRVEMVDSPPVTRSTPLVTSQLARQYEARVVEDLFDADELVDEEELRMAKKPQARLLGRLSKKSPQASGGEVDKSSKKPPKTPKKNSSFD